MVFLKRKPCEVIQKHSEERRSLEDGVRDWSDAVTSQGNAQIYGNYQKLQRGKGASLESSKEAQSCQHLNFVLPASRNVRE